MSSGASWTKEGVKARIRQLEMGREAATYWRQTADERKAAVERNRANADAGGDKKSLGNDSEAYKDGSFREWQASKVVCRYLRGDASERWAILNGGCRSGIEQAAEGEEEEG